MSEVYVSRRKFAEIVGVTHTYINGLCREGRLPVTVEGIPMYEGVEAYEKMSGKTILSRSKPKKARLEGEALFEDIEPYIMRFEQLPDEISERLFKCETVEELDSILYDEISKIVSDLVDHIWPDGSNNGDDYDLNDLPDLPNVDFDE